MKPIICVPLSRKEPLYENEEPLYECEEAL
jgi:hypothetical protein